MMNEIKEIEQEFIFSEILLVSDSMTGQDAVNVATARSRLVGDIDEVIEQEIQARRVVDESVSKSDERAAQKILTSALDTDEGSTFFQRVKAVKCGILMAINTSIH